MRVVYVSAFIVPKSNELFRSSTEYQRCFERMAQSGIDLRLFLDKSMKDYGEDVVQRFPNVKLLDEVESEELPPLRFDDFQLPSQRNLRKDTAEYILIQHRKLPLVERAVQLETDKDNDTFFAWIDFGFFHLIEDDASKQRAVGEALRNVSLLSLPTERIISPGCWHRKIVQQVDLWNQICWRFCGSFLIGHHSLWSTAAQRQQELVQQNLPRITWEVNMWTVMEDLFFVLPANHNALLVLCLFQHFGFRSR